MKQRRGWSSKNCKVSRDCDRFGASLDIVQLYEVSASVQTPEWRGPRVA